MKILFLIKREYGNLSIIKKSLIVSSLMSLIIPFLLLPVRIFFDYLIRTTEIKSIPILNYILYTSAPVYFEYILFHDSYLWIIIRFTPIIILGYLNGILLSTYFKKIHNEMGYLIISSVIIYLLSLYLGFKLFVFLYSVPSFAKILIKFTEVGGL